MSNQVKKIIRKLDNNYFVINSQSQRNSGQNSPERLPKSARRLVQSLKFGQSSENSPQKSGQQQQNQQKTTKQQNQGATSQIRKIKPLKQLRKMKNIQVKAGIKHDQKINMNQILVLQNKINSSRVITPFCIQKHENMTKQQKTKNNQLLNYSNERSQVSHKMQANQNQRQQIESQRQKNQFHYEKSREEKSSEDPQNMSYQAHNLNSFNANVNNKLSFQNKQNQSFKEHSKKEEGIISQNKRKQIQSSSYYQKNSQQNVSQIQNQNQNNQVFRSNSKELFNEKNSISQCQDQSKIYTQPQSPDSLSISAVGDTNYISHEIMQMQENQKQMKEYITSYYKKKNEYPPTLPEFYKFEKFIGKGASSKVVLATHKLTGLKVAIKTISKKRMVDEHSRNKIFQEIFILKKIRHRHIIKFYEVFESKRHLMIVMEYASGGDLLSFVRNRKRLSEQESKCILKQLLTALAMIHDNGILHRDVKLDNILLNGDFSSVKVCDFGVSKLVKKGVMIHDHCGTPAYIAPEVIAEKGYEGYAADI